MRETWVQSPGQEDPLEKEMAVFFLGKFPGQRSLVGYNPWSLKESDVTEHTYTPFPPVKICFLYLKAPLL